MIEFLVRRGAFRNANHATWFLASVGFLALYLNALLDVISLQNLALTLAVVHAFPMATAYAKRKSSQSSEIYTSDCVWFNAVLVVVYLVLHYL